MANRSRIQGIGINDADYPYRVHEKIDGKYKIVYQCSIHGTWKDLLRRCYNEKYKEKYPHYRDVTCCDEWLIFSNFKRWVESQGSLVDKDGKTKQLDKDLLVPNNKHYSPENCILVSVKINSFMFNNNKGVTFNKEVGEWHVFCKDPLKRYSKYIGKVDNLEEGRVLYRKTKHRYLKDLHEAGYLDSELFNKLCKIWFNEFT